jgi:hypothetical protein
VIRPPRPRRCSRFNGRRRETAENHSLTAFGIRSSKTFPFDQTLEALAYVEQGRANGKVVITLD